MPACPSTPPLPEQHITFPATPQGLAPQEWAEADWQASKARRVQAVQAERLAAVLRAVLACFP